MNLIDAALHEGQFVSFVAMLRLAGLVDQLANTGPYTVFAPTDEAFERVDPNVMARLLADPALLRQVLLYHIVPDRLPADVLRDRDLRRLATLQGEPLALDWADDGVLAANDVEVAGEAVAADNGVIHPISQVLRPQSMAVIVPVAA